MKRLVVVAILSFLAWQVHARYQTNRALKESPARAAEINRFSSPLEGPRETAPDTPDSQFKCDGRTHCSQMTSCEEATFFLQNCPGVKMDGDNDSVPCEQQWCR
jgi:hypothetical protein